MDITAFCTFLAALCMELLDSISDNKFFKIPDITILDTKLKHLAALCIVHDSPVSHWKEIQKRNKLIIQHVHSVHGTKKSTGKGTFQYSTTLSTNNLQNPILYQHSSLLADTTLQKYRGPSSGRPTQKSEIPTVIDSITGKHRPFNKEQNYTSKFDIAFRGCHNCKATYH